MFCSLLSRPSSFSSSWSSSANLFKTNNQTNKHNEKHWKCEKKTHHQHHEPGMPFDFSYSVNDVATANDYAHKAVSDGDVTRGEYRVALPDGRTQIVRYTADWKNGYNAEVRSSSSTPHQTPFSTHNSIENSRHTTYSRFLSKYILLVLWR